MGGEKLPLLGYGDMKLVVLDSLKDQARHGYEIIKVLESKGGGFYSPSPGAIYPTLQMLEDLEYVTSIKEGTRKIYQITPTGLDYLEKNEDTLKEIAGRIDRSYEQSISCRNNRDKIGSSRHNSAYGKLSPGRKVQTCPSS